MREAKARAVDVTPAFRRQFGEWKLPVIMFADATLLLADKERNLHILVNDFDSGWERRNLIVNLAKASYCF